MAGMGITTICITGFDVTAQPRELKNLCRFMVGFEGSHVAFSTQGAGVSSLFVKFHNGECAQAAIDTVLGQPFDLDNPVAVLRAEFARREMEVRPGSLMPSVKSFAAGGTMTSAIPSVGVTSVVGGYGGGGGGGCGGYGGGGGGGSRVGITGGELVTIAVLGLREKGTDPESLRQWFSERPGFCALQINERIDAVFVKFSSAAAAANGIEDANAQNLGAEWARRNLDDDRTGGAAAVPMVGMPVAGGVGLGGGGHMGGRGFPAPARSSAPFISSGEQIVTIAIMGLKEKGLFQDDLLAYFQVRPGFSKLQINERIGGCFVKFSSVAEAEAALQDANQAGFGADWARRNLDDDLGQKHAVMASMSMHQGMPVQQGSYGGGGGGGGKRQRVQTGELDTITVLHLGEKEQTLGAGKAQQWFQERPGFMALQINERIDALFVKFSSAHQAENAIQDAASVGIGAEWARRNLDL